MNPSWTYAHTRDRAPGKKSKTLAALHSGEDLGDSIISKRPLASTDSVDLAWGLDSNMSDSRDLDVDLEPSKKFYRRELLPDLYPHAKFHHHC